MKSALKQWRRRDVDEENELRCTSRKFDEIICERRMKKSVSSQKKRKSSSNKFFVRFAIRRRIFDA
jgi:hypothetical protein